jgi:hypothetical protein
MVGMMAMPPDARSYRFKRQWRDGQRQRLLKAQGGRCLLCPAVDQPGARLHQAHAAGAWPYGDDTATVLLCAACHRRFDSASAKAVTSDEAPGFTYPLPPGLTPSLHQGDMRSRSSVLAEDGSGPHQVGAGSPAFPPNYAGMFGGGQPGDS